MAISVYPITSSFIAEIGDVDLSQPLSSSGVGEIKQAFWDYRVLIFPGQDLTEEQVRKGAAEFFARMAKK